jgi:hypothetical protein
VNPTSTKRQHVQFSKTQSAHTMSVLGQGDAPL